MLVRTSKTARKLAREGRERRRKAVLEGRLGWTRREFFSAVGRALGAGSLLVLTPKLVWEVVEESSRVVPLRHKVIFLVKVREQSAISLRVVNPFEVLEPEDAGRKQIERLSAKLDELAKNLDVRFTSLFQPSKPRRDMKKGRAELTKYFAVAAETSEPEKVFYNLKKSHFAEMVAIVPETPIKPTSVPNDYFANGAPGMHRGYIYDWQNIVTGIYYADDILREAIRRRGIENKEPTKVGILDAEFYPHEDLKPWINEDEMPNNGIDDDKDGYIDNYICWSYDATRPGGCNIRDFYPDHHFMFWNHGTGVAGAAGARWNNIVGVTGTTANLTQLVFALMYSYVRTDPDVIKNDNLGLFGLCTYLADMGVRVINMSFRVSDGIVDGSGNYSGTNKEFLSMLHDYFKNLQEDGVVLVAAAGNEAPNMDGRDRVTAPAKLPSTIAVGATMYADFRIDRGLFPAVFSCKGRQWKRVENGEFIEGGNRVIFAPGTNIWTTNYSDVLGDNMNSIGIRESYYTIMAGTSLASPIVAGFLGGIIHVWPEIAQNRESIDFLRDLVMGGGALKGIATQPIDGLVLPDINLYPTSICTPLGNGYMRVNIPDAQMFRADKLALAVESIVERGEIPKPPPMRRRVRRA